MYHRDVIATIARQLPDRTRRDVAEVVEILLKVWSEELATGGEIILPGVGRLSIEVQEMQAGGALAAHGRLSRVDGRFRLTESLKAWITEVEDA